MKKKTYHLVVGIVTAVQTVSTAVVTYVQPSYAVAIVSGIGIVAGAALEVCNLFVKNE